MNKGNVEKGGNSSSDVDDIAVNWQLHQEFYKFVVGKCWNGGFSKNGYWLLKRSLL